MKSIYLEIATGHSHSFLVKHGLLTGEPTKTLPASREKLVLESSKP